MASKNSRALPKSTVEPAFRIVLRILIVIAILQVIAALVVLAPRLVCNVAGQLAAQAKLSDATTLKNEETSMLEGNHQKNPSLPLKSLTNSAQKTTFNNSKSATSTSSVSLATTGETGDGLQPGASLGIINIEHKSGMDGEHILKIAIKARPREVISVPDVKVQVYFYDEQDGSIVVSKAPVASRWLNPPVDWKDSDPQLLEVTYQPDASTGDAHYAGYIVAIYYKGQLQGYKANPVDLTTQFPIKVYIGPNEL